MEEFVHLRIGNTAFLPEHVTCVKMEVWTPKRKIGGESTLEECPSLTLEMIPQGDHLHSCLCELCLKAWTLILRDSAGETQTNTSPPGPLSNTQNLTSEKSQDII